MNDEDIDLKLIANEPIYIEGAGEIVFPIARNVIRLGATYYSQLLSNLLITKFSLENSEDFAFLSDFELFCLYCYHNEQFKEVAFNGLRLFFEEEKITLEDIDKPKVDKTPICFIRLGDLIDDRRIDENNFKIIQQIIAKANFITLLTQKIEPEFNPVDDRARQIVEQIMRGRKERVNVKPKNAITLHSIIAGLTWKPNGNSAKDVLELSIYQIYMGYFVTQNIDSHHFTLTGIYTGNIDAKEIDLSDYNWAKSIKN